MPRRLLLSLLLIVCCGCSSMEALRVRDRQRLPLDGMVQEIRKAPLIFLGEVHTDSAHHELQLQVLRQVRQVGGDVALACEMFTAASQPLLDIWFAGAMDDESFEHLYRQEWRNTPYGLYEEIFRFARTNRIRVIGINVRREIIQKVARSGCASLSDAERQELPEEVSCEAGSAMRELMERVLAHHPRTEDRSFNFFVEAQALWNSAMARRLSEFMAGNPGTRVVVLVGGGHAFRRAGIPGQMPYKMVRDARIVIPEINGIDAGNVTPDLGDYLLLQGVNPFLETVLGN